MTTLLSRFDRLRPVRLPVITLQGIVLLFCPVSRIYGVNVAAFVLCLEVNMASLRDVDDIARASGNDSAIDLDLKGSLEHDVVLIIGERPLEAGVIQFHHATTHARSLFQGNDIL